MFQQVDIKSIKVRSRRRKDLGDINALAASIQDVGLLHPIVVDKAHRLIAGERRLRAVKQLRWKQISASVVTNLNEASQLIRAERDENVCRKDFTPLEAVAIGKELEELEQPGADERAKAGRKKGGQTAGRGRPKADSLRETFPQANSIRVRDEIGASVGMSGRTYEKAKAVAESGEPRLAKMEQMLRDF